MTLTGASPTHPGEVLRDVLRAANMSQAEFARRTGFSKKHINRIIRGKNVYTADAAVQFSKALGYLNAGFWMQVLSNYETALAQEKEAHKDDNLTVA